MSGVSATRGGKARGLWVEGRLGRVITTPLPPASPRKEQIPGEELVARMQNDLKPSDVVEELFHSV